MTTLYVIFMALLTSQAFDLGGTSYPDSAVLHANFTDGSQAIFKPSDEQLYLCEDEQCSCKQPMTLEAAQAQTEEETHYISSLSLCDIECVTCSFTGYDWECTCPEFYVMNSNIKCVEECPPGQTPGQNGLCEPKYNPLWVKLEERRQRMPTHDFTFHIDAVVSTGTGILMTTQNMVIGTNFVEVFGTRYEFADAQCLSDVCSYIVSCDDDRILFWVDKELVGTAPVQRMVNIQIGEKIKGDGVLDVWYIAAIMGPQRTHPSVRRSLQAHGNCHERCKHDDTGEDYCLIEQDPTSCTKCASYLWEYCTDIDSDEDCPYYICLEECPSGLIETTDPYQRCYRAADERQIRTIWDKFEAYGTDHEINETKENIGVAFYGGIRPDYEVIDPIPAWERGLYFNGYSTGSSFHGLNLGCDFNLGFWLKPFRFDGLFSIFNSNRDLILQLIRREPTNENELPTIGWTQQTYGAYNQFYATAMIEPSLQEFYQLENIWWMFTLRINAGYAADVAEFAASSRIYYNKNFGGDTINLVHDYFEDKREYAHVLGYNGVDKFFHGFIADMIYYNWGTVNFSELIVQSVSDCISCVDCPATSEFFNCQLTQSARACRRISPQYICPDCCDARLVFNGEECVECGLLCYSCEAHESGAAVLEVGICDICVEYAEQKPVPGLDCVCMETYVHDTINNRCCEPFCHNCSAAAFWCDECFWGYSLQLKTGVDEFGEPRLGNECVQNTCLGGFVLEANLCQCPQGYYILGEDCDEFNQCTCTSGQCECVQIQPCYSGCSLCNGDGQDLSRCFQCENDHFDIAPFISDDPYVQYAYCVPECPSGFTAGCLPDVAMERIITYHFNYPLSSFTNLSAYSGIGFSLVTDLPSGAPAKNRGIHFDGVGNAYIELDSFVLNHSFTIALWCYSFGGSSQRMVFFDKEGTLISYVEGDVTGVEIFSQGSTDTGGFSTAGLVARSWNFLAHEYEMINGQATDIRIYVDASSAFTASASNFIIDSFGVGNIGAQRSGGNYINKFNGYFYQYSLIQSSSQSTYRTQVRTNEGCAVNDCWAVEFNQYQTDSDTALSCSTDCINDQKGCINERDCRDDCQNGGQWCHLCLDYECQNCIAYDTCEMDGCAPNSEHLDDYTCICDEPLYGRDFNIDRPCAECHATCDTCVFEGIDGCLTCTPGIRERLDPDVYNSECICLDGFYPDPTHADCSDCHENCLTCFGGESFECINAQCKPNFYQWTTSELPDANVVCLLECPTGYTAHESPFRYCERIALSNWQFDFFPRQTTDLEVNGLTIAAAAGNAPTAVFGRGLYFDGIGNYLEMGNINIGTEFSWHIWFRADAPDTAFTSLVSIVDASNNNEIFRIGLSDSQDSIQAEFVSTYNFSTKFASETAANQRDNGNFAITGQWNSLGYTQYAVRNAADSSNRFGTECRFFINHFRPADFSWEHGQYMEDNQAFKHNIGYAADGSAYQGHIATINFFNFRVEDFDNIASINTSSCPTCTSCPVEKAYTQCVDDCEFVMTGACIADCADLKVPICPVDCDIGHYQEADLSCRACTNGADSCRLSANDRFCDDILCTSCFPLYSECNHPDSCVEFASVVNDDCHCIDKYHVDHTTNTCTQSCHEICVDCEGPAIWQCTECASGFELDVLEPNKTGILCVGECPTGFTTVGNKCVRIDFSSYVFDFYRRQDSEFDVRGLGFYSGAQPGADNEDASPVYGRGGWYDGSSSARISNFNLGQDWTFSMWFFAYQFGTLFSITDSNTGNEIFNIHSDLVNGIEVAEFNLETILGQSFEYASQGQANLAQNHGWGLRDQWNNMGINFRSHYVRYDDATDEYVFASQIKMFMNEYGNTDHLDVENDYWFEDRVAYSHMVARDYDNTDSFEGFIGDLVFGNYAYEGENYVTSTYPGTCPTAVEASESKDYVACVDNCKRTNSSQGQFDSCVDDNCTHDPFCADMCPRDQFMDEDNGFVCTDCDPRCNSCRNAVTCDGCDDIRCTSCSTYYGICDGGCKPYATYNDATELCVCDFEFDLSSYNCCYENCIQCSDATGPCDVCAEFWFGSYCNVRCVNGTYFDVDGTCSCDIGWSGAACDIRCNSVCRTCEQSDENLCTSCFGNKIGDLCEFCLATWYPNEDCTVECVNGIYNNFDRTCSCDIGWSGAACDIRCNSVCRTCAQDNKNLCLSCFGNKVGDLCEFCLATWYPNEDCTVECVNGSYNDFDRTCSCDIGWSEAACDIQCYSECRTCAQDNESLCLSCYGNKTGDLCELCLDNWFAPGDCTVECINGTYEDGACTCDEGWSGAACSIRCNSVCKHCAQDDKNFCVSCHGNKTSNQCELCIATWFAPEDCTVQCVNGTYLAGSPGSCECDEGWSGEACNIRCNSACKHCAQYDANLCLDCYGNKYGFQCEICIDNYFPPGDCTEGCVNGNYSNGICTCDEGWSGAACDIRCNSYCRHCAQEDENFCVSCHGNKTGDQCQRCIANWFAPEDCTVECINGVYVAGSPGSCSCDEGWSGAACNIQCNSACRHCAQDDENFCVSCYGNKAGNLCELCIANFFAPGDCSVECVNGTYDDGARACSCDEGWSGAACNIRCNSVCRHCAQDDINFCVSCYGNKIGNQCELCLANWYPTEACTVECINGVYSNGACTCNEGWSGAACDIQCYSECRTCAQDNQNLCLSCYGNKIGDLCELCIDNYFPPGDCTEGCVNGNYFNGICTCDEGWSGAACDIRCNSYCKHCAQDDENFCVSCDGNRIGDQCELCLPFWYGPGRCVTYCVNGTFVDGDPGTCDCDAGWSGVSCDIRCNDACPACAQDDPDQCSDCEGHKIGDQCQLCVAHWFPPEDCTINCVNGAYDDGNRTCSCNEGWSGAACDIRCNSACKHCLQDDINFCVSCHGNKTGELCELCIANWFAPGACDVECHNGVYTNGRTPGVCTCDVGWSGLACNIRCNSACTSCSQIDQNVCADCEGKKIGNACEFCESTWFPLLDCTVQCVNGTYNDRARTCSCDEGWSGAACDMRCYSACKTCAQDNPDLCLTCHGNQTGDLCELCLNFWYPPEDCSVKCVNGLYLDGTGICSCDEGWSGAACDIRCNSVCKICAQDDENLCLECFGNKIGDQCERCLANWFPNGDCSVECINGTYEDGACSCDQGWSRAACDIRCNSACVTCAQNNENLCLTCAGNKVGDLCELCLSNWYAPGDCTTECVNGTYLDSFGTCQCDAGWSGLACNIRCNAACTSCLQTDENICADCDGNKFGNECELCISTWYPPYDCTVQCINGTYDDGARSCSCDAGWSGDACAIRCNSKCHRCFQNNAQVCTECPGNQALTACTTCLPNWTGEDCNVQCYEGQGVYVFGACACLAGWAGPDCNTPCNSACYMCAQEDANFCTECPGNYDGIRCDICRFNWDLSAGCEQCLPGYFHESEADQNCQHQCINGNVSADDLTCTCFDFYSQDENAPRGTCKKIECFQGCAECTDLFARDYSTCSSCKVLEGWVDPDESEKSDGEQRTCTFGCPSGYITVNESPLECDPDLIFDLNVPSAQFNFNVPGLNYQNVGYAPDVDISVCSEGFSGVPAKNRGICLDGTGNGVVKLDNYLLNTSFFVDMWFMLRPDTGACSLMHKRDLMDLRITYGNREWEHEMGTAFDTEGTHTIGSPSANGVFTDQFQNLIYSYEIVGGRATDAKYYIDGGLVKVESIDRIVIDDINNPAYIGGKYESNSLTGCDNLVNKCNGCFYDFVLTQTVYVPEFFGRVDVGGEPPVFWDVELDEWVDDDGEVQQCHESCVYGCVDENPCAAINEDDECRFCYLCYDKECNQCDSYEVCNACEPSRSEPFGDHCTCSEGYGREDHTQTCVGCHSDCGTCNGPNSNDCLTCNDGNQITGIAPAKCVCNDRTYPNPNVNNCSPCHESCAQCVGPNETDCIECSGAQYLSGTAPAMCVCQEGFYRAADSGECVVCHASCKNCVGGTESQCYECNEGAYLSQSGECRCYQGPVSAFTTATDARSCEITECAHNCGGCLNYPWRCTSCTSASPLINNSCGCPSGYTYQPDTAGDPCVPEAQCHYTCETCFAPNDPNACNSCHANASPRFEDRPSWCDCDYGYYPSWTSDNCVPHPPTLLGFCESPCGTCLDDDPNYCLTCGEGAELSVSNVGSTCVCKEGYQDERGHCTQICAEYCKSCLISDTSLCTECEDGYDLREQNPAAPSPCVPYASLCPENCCDCDLNYPGTCISCCTGHGMEIDHDNNFVACVENEGCHPTCKECFNSSPNSCVSCYANANIVNPRLPYGAGACECNNYYLPTPMSNNCMPQCHEDCATCIGPGWDQCTSCNSGMKLMGSSPCPCKHTCHFSCKECYGPGKDQCSECGENMNHYYDRCMCYDGYEMDPEVGCIYIGYIPEATKITFDHCASSYTSNTITLVGQSYDLYAHYPLPVDNRGVFFNNKTYFRVDGLFLGASFAMNAWIKSHDTGYATIFSINGECQNRGGTIEEFSWRLANSTKRNRKRHNMIELTDWTQDDSNPILAAFDTTYMPQRWNNLAVSVAFDWETELSTISFYSQDKSCFILRAAISTPKRFTRNSIENTHTIGNRISRNDEPVNSFLGFMYYYAVYSYAETQFTASIGDCHGCHSGCGPQNVCLGNCWHDQFDDKNGTCCECNSVCQTCYLDQITCYCSNRHRRS